MWVQANGLCPWETVNAGSEVIASSAGGTSAAVSGDRGGENSPVPKVPPDLDYMYLEMQSSVLHLAATGGPTISIAAGGGPLQLASL